MITPKFLKPGDTLGICAPSARFDTEKFDSGIRVLKTLGFKVMIPDDIFGQKRYLAGDDILRAGVVNRLFSDPGINGIMCARGGFGAIRILDYLDWQMIRQHPKLFIGYSDITAILMSILEKTGITVVHGPNVVSLAEADKDTLDSFVTALTGFSSALDIAGARMIRPGACQGILKGGNLATLSHLLGTRFQPDFTDAVFFFEDIGEPAYKIDRMLTQMKMAGMFDRICGVIAGSFKNCDHDGYIEEIVGEIFDEYKVPVLSGLGAGHGNINQSLFLGAQIRMDTRTLSLHWL